MAHRSHTYVGTITWTGNNGTGTSSQTDYQRAYDIEFSGKPIIAGSSDPSFRGIPERHNPEDLLVASVSACHMLWYLSLSAKAGNIVTGYVDRAEGTMVEDRDGGGHFSGVVLRPVITLAAGSDQAVAESIHHEAHEKCFVSQSVNFPITVEAEYRFA
jgi:organic hydroperoxide reductase OsmC/OhrA